MGGGGRVGGWEGGRAGPHEEAARHVTLVGFFCAVWVCTSWHHLFSFGPQAVRYLHPRAALTALTALTVARDCDSNARQSLARKAETGGTSSRTGGCERPPLPTRSNPILYGGGCGR